MFRKNRIGKKAFGFSLVLALMVFTGCTLEEGTSLGGIWLGGTWSTQYDRFIIDMEELELVNEYYDGDGGWDVAYSGDIIGISMFDPTATAGVIFIFYDQKPIDWDTQAPPAENIIGIYFRNLTSTTGQFASPVEEDDDENIVTPAKASLAEAKAAFTKDEMDDYIRFGWVTYQKQK
ncbi:MAG: hypothetical protein LBC80_10105 [Treponema sp.]|jgi:hypothetical protein|nr:hypothetical protein [Treponema sp.]